MKQLTIDHLDELAMDCSNYLDMESGEVVFVSEESSGTIGCIIDNGDTSQFEEIPNFDSRELFEWMRIFIETIGDDAIQSRLDGAISQRKPFRRFRDELAGDRRLERQWREFEAARQREAIIEWLHGIGVEATHKEFPKDIDLLVTISDDCDLVPLAELGRQLNGHMNSHGAGADDVPADVHEQLG